jgi:dUTP pyrophosphatase
MFTKKIKIVNESAFDLPERATEHAAGFDLRSDFNYAVELYKPGSQRKIKLKDIRKKTGTIALPPGARALIDTGLIIELPASYEAQIRPRSGLAVKQGLTVLNSPGTIDADYRGHIKVILYNSSDKIVRVKHGDRIAQLVIQKLPKVKLVKSARIKMTKRAAKGFGSTGIN